MTMVTLDEANTISEQEIKEAIAILKKNEKKPVWRFTWEFPFLKRFYEITDSGFRGFRGFKTLKRVKLKHPNTSLGSLKYFSPCYSLYLYFTNL